MDHRLGTLAPSITKEGSRQTYYTIRLLVDRERVDDAYRAYGYFRWLDDLLDADSGSEIERRALLDRQKSLLERSYKGETLPDTSVEEKMLVELIHNNREKDSGLEAYLRNMMQVLDFDAGRRGLLISQVELHGYTRWLARAVTEAMHYFIGNGWYAPQGKTRYLLVSAAHIAHMLRDTFEDLQAGYFNIPREVLDANLIGPQDVHSHSYRAWVRGRVRLAREYFEAGKSHLARVQNRRCRLAGLAYTARFEWLLDTIEADGFHLRADYGGSRGPGTGLRLSWLVLSSLGNLRGGGYAASHGRLAAVR
jgi:phytoene/squalene synthetase